MNGVPFQQPRRIVRLLVVMGLLGLTTATASAVDVPNVLVLYNKASKTSSYIAQFYSSVHPGVRLLGLYGLSTSETISSRDYLNIVRPQVLGALDSSIDVIVTTKGLPLRIDNGAYANPGNYVDPFGTQRTVFPSTWKRYSSLESELTRVDTFSTPEQLGDQTWWYTAGVDQQPHPASNPYFRSDASFSYDDYGIRLTSRLDGFSDFDVALSIRRAQSAFVGSDQNPEGPSHFVFDDNPPTSYDRLSQAANDVLGPRGLPVTYDDTSGFVGDAPGPVLGYVGWGRNQSATPLNYISNKSTGLKFSIANGGVFQSWESYNAYTFDPAKPVPSGQGSLAQWIGRGGTAGVGHVEEPYASSANVANTDVMFQMLLDGYTWAEAAWAATPQLSYVNTVVGDPLMVWRTLIPGDVDRNGIVDSADVQAVVYSSPNWGKTGKPGGSMWTSGDVNCDGVVDFLDWVVVKRHFGQTSDWWDGAATVGDTYQLLLPGGLSSGDLAAIPEPSSFALAIGGLLAIAVVGRRSWTDRFRRRRGGRLAAKSSRGASAARAARAWSPSG